MTDANFWGTFALFLLSCAGAYAFYRLLVVLEARIKARKR